jgi:hypothetical protein
MTMQKRRWMGYPLVYAMWLAILLLGVWFLLTSRDALLGLVDMLDVNETTSHAWRLISMERFYLVGAGMVWLVVMVFSEAYLRRGVARGRLVSRFARIFGVVVLLTFVADVTLFALQGFQGGWLRWLIPAAELALGVVCVREGRKAPSVWADIKASN